MKQEVKGLIGLTGVLFACLAVDLNSEVTSVALPDIRGGFGLSFDSGSWLGTLYSGGECVGMAIAAYWALTLGIRRYLLGVIALCCIVSVAIPFAPDPEMLFPLRCLQGLSQGLTIPLLMAIALHVLPPAIRLYGLAAYALTATFFPYLGITVASLWLDGLDWRFTFFQAIPICAIAAVLVWFGIPDVPPEYSRLRKFDWHGAILVLVGFGAFSVLLTQGDRLDWFNSQMICLCALTVIVAMPLLLLNEYFHEMPLLKIQLLARPNFAFGVLGLFCFLIISLGALQLPFIYLQDIQGLRPRDYHVLSLLVALPQLVLLPAVAVLLDRAWVDARVVAFCGLVIILISLIGDSCINSSWQGDQFLVGQALYAIGAPMVVMPMLLTATNAVTASEGQFASPLINTPRALAEITGTWLVQLILRWRGALHTDRIQDSVGSARFGLQRPGAFSFGQFHISRYVMSQAGALSELAAQQAQVLTIADAFRIVAGAACVMMLIVIVLPKRTYPPRIALAKK